MSGYCAWHWDHACNVSVSHGEYIMRFSRPTHLFLNVIYTLSAARTKCMDVCHVMISLGAPGREL